jgi:hypothetical protein
MRGVAARTPSLLTHLPRDTVDNRLVSLASLLGLPSADVAATAVSRAPAVLIEPPGMVEAQLGHLERILGVRPQEAAALAAAQPGLLLLPPPVMRTRLEALAATLKVGAQAARELACLAGPAPRQAVSGHPGRSHPARPTHSPPRPQIDIEDARTVAVKRPALLTAPTSALRRAAHEAGVP